MPETALVIMARYPETGKTKTRLAQTLGATETAQLYHAFLVDLAQRFGGHSPVHLHWTYTPPDVDYAAFAATLAPAYAQNMTSFPQQGSDFNSRLQHVFAWTHAQGYTQTIVISSDSPQISTQTIDRAIAALAEVDVVLGPAEDGGYYLLAMHHPYDLFTGIPMSTEVVLQMTLDLAHQQHLSTRNLETLFDIDEITDLQRLATLLNSDSSLAPHTATFLRSLQQEKTLQIMNEHA